MTGVRCGFPTGPGSAERAGVARAPGPGAGAALAGAVRPGPGLAAPECMRLDLHDLTIPLGELELQGLLAIPRDAAGLVVFAQGSGRGRHSPRNRRIAAVLQDHRLATLLLDLLTVEEDRIDAIDTTLRSGVELLAERLVAATDHMVAGGQAGGLSIGYFGGSTGAASALIAAARRPAWISAVVSSGGRPDLAGAALAAVRAPTLSIVGSIDTWVLRANREAAAQMIAPRRVDVIPGASHRFEEPGALDEVARLAASWFVDHLAPSRMKEAS